MARLASHRAPVRFLPCSLRARVSFFSLNFVCCSDASNNSFTGVLPGRLPQQLRHLCARLGQITVVAVHQIFCCCGLQCRIVQDNSLGGQLPALGSENCCPTRVLIGDSEGATVKTVKPAIPVVRCSSSAADVGQRLSSDVREYGFRVSVAFCGSTVGENSVRVVSTLDLSWDSALEIECCGPCAAFPGAHLICFTLGFLFRDACSPWRQWLGLLVRIAVPRVRGRLHRQMSAK